jgi:hypothetical protein
MVSIADLMRPPLRRNGTSKASSWCAISSTTRHGLDNLRVAAEMLLACALIIERGRAG